MAKPKGRRRATEIKSVADAHPPVVKISLNCRYQPNFYKLVTETIGENFDKLVTILRESSSVGYIVCSK